MERVLMKLEVLKNETMSKLNELFRQKVQLEEQWKENEYQLQYQRGVFAALEQSQKAVREIQQGERIEAMKAKKNMPISIPSGDGSKEGTKVPEVKV